MEGLVVLGEKSEPRVWNWVHATAALLRLRTAPSTVDRRRPRSSVAFVLSLKYFRNTDVKVPLRYFVKFEFSDINRSLLSVQLLPASYLPTLFFSS